MRIIIHKKAVFIRLITVLILSKSMLGLAFSPDDKITDLNVYQDFAIYAVQHFDKEFLINQKIVIQSAKNYNPFKEIFSEEKKKVPEFGPTIWEITINQLPVTDQQCLEIDSGTCNDVSEFPRRYACTNPCIMYGPEFLAFDEQSKKLFIAAHSVSGGGNAAWPLFSFIADLETRTIKFFQTIYGPTHASFSPGGKYLSLYSGGYATLYDVATGKNNEIFARKAGFIKSFTWISSEKFQIEYSEPESVNSKKFINHKQVFEVKI